MFPHASNSICVVWNNTFIKRFGENSDFQSESINDTVSNLFEI